MACNINGWLPNKSAFSGFKKTGKNPTDRAKQGVKRSLLTDENGLPLAVVSDGANVHDIKLVLQTLDALECYRPPLKVPLYLDKGYTGQWLHDELVALNYIPHVQSRAEEAASLNRMILRLIVGLWSELIAG
ncbi:IS5/IS1182 family transposase [Vibrio cholerae]|nr:transposase DDE domain protein [Vibrio cholerae]BCK30225.1 hypothetical protein VCSRO77_3644 [Vibrio cholerae]GHX20690.1 IS5/IS1182 family transposase [Vibrio cholerae]GHX59595.1 IS5/IS1182 family transposase [Vibrio cholerae]